MPVNKRLTTIAPEKTIAARMTASARSFTPLMKPCSEYPIRPTVYARVARVRSNWDGSKSSPSPVSASAVRRKMKKKASGKKL